MSSNATMAVLFKDYIAKMPDTFDTKKEIEEYLRNGLDSIVMERKAAEKAAKTAEAAERFIEKAKKAAEKEAEKAKKPKKEKNAALANPEKEAEKAKKIAEKEAEKAKKIAEKEAEKAKKIAEKEAEKAKKEKNSNGSDTERKIFEDEMRIKIKEMFPDLNPQQTTKKIAELWKVNLARLAEANEEAMNAAINTSS